MCGENLTFWNGAGFLGGRTFCKRDLSDITESKFDKSASKFNIEEENIKKIKMHGFKDETLLEKEVFNNEKVSPKTPRQSLERNKARS